MSSATGRSTRLAELQHVHEIAGAEVQRLTDLWNERGLNVYEDHALKTLTEIRETVGNVLSDYL